MGLVSKLVINNKEVGVHNSPTVELRTHLNYAFYNGTQLSRLTKIMVLDENGVEREGIENITLTADGTKVRISGSYEATGNYTITKVKLYSYNTPYFILTPSSSVGVLAGELVSIDASIGLTVNGFKEGYISYGDKLPELFRDVLMGTRTAGDLNITKVKLYLLNKQTNTEEVKEFDPTKELGGYWIYLKHGFIAEYDLKITKSEVFAGTNRLYYWVAQTPIEVRRGYVILYDERLAPYKVWL